jgi:hypothetical protein
MHLRILPDHPKHGLKKDIFQRLDWLKTHFEAFAHASRPPEEKKNFTSGVVKTVFRCIIACFQTTRNIGVVKNVF